MKHMKTIHQNTVYHCATPAQVKYIMTWTFEWKHFICDISLETFPLLSFRTSLPSAGSRSSGIWERIRGVWDSRELLPATACNASRQAEQTGLFTGECGIETHHARGRLFYDCRFLLYWWVKSTCFCRWNHCSFLFLICVWLGSFILKEVDNSDMSSDDEAKDFKFVKWLIKEKVNIYQLYLR